MNCEGSVGGRVVFAVDASAIKHVAQRAQVPEAVLDGVTVAHHFSTEDESHGRLGGHVVIVSVELIVGLPVAGQKQESFTDDGLEFLSDIHRHLLAML
jgi:hypothetical protein